MTEPTLDDPDVSSPNSLKLAEAGTSRISRDDSMVNLRLEGPYFTMDDPAAFDTVICIVAGTGVSGAMAIASAFRGLDSPASGHSLGEDDDGSESPTSTIQPPSLPEKLPAVRDIAAGQKCARQRLWRRCIVVWTVREDHYVDLPGLTGMPPSVSTLSS